jgi:r-opsin
LFVFAWTPYAFVALTAAFGNRWNNFTLFTKKSSQTHQHHNLHRAVLTPLMSMVPACCCKGVACINPWMYAINHPRYR